MGIGEFMKINKKRILLLLIILMFVCVIIVACGDGGSSENPNNTDSAGVGQQNDENKSGDSSASGDGEYNYPDIDGKGKKLLVLNATNEWGFYCNMDFEEEPGELLETAIYNRNRFIEEKFNITLNIQEIDMWVIYANFRTRIYSGMDVFDIAYMPGSVWDRSKQQVIGGLATEGLLADLTQINSINLEGKWWNQTSRQESLINKKLFFAENDIHIMTLQTMSCVYFNKDMMTNLGLELPYGMVRGGTWTFDRLLEYQKAGMNLNGADMFATKASNPSVYGLTASETNAPALLLGSKEKFVVMDANGYPQLAAGGDRWMNVIDKMHEIFNGPIGMYCQGNNPGYESDCAQIFKNGKALAMLGELRQSTESLRAMDTDFGIAPMPKYDEKQDGYYNLRFHLIPLAIIPFNSENPEFAGAVLDAWAYKSYKDVTPVLFDVAVSHKGLRDEDSIDMLQIVRDSGSFCVGMIYGWTTNLFTSIQDTLGFGKKFNAASQIEKLRDTMQGNIDKTMEFFEE